MNLGQVYPDADAFQHHNHALRAYWGRAFLRTNHFCPLGDVPGPENARHSIMLSVPFSMHRAVLEERPAIRALMALVPWAEGSGIGILVVDAGADAVLAVVDIAGRGDHAELQVAARSGKVAAGISSNEDPNITPMVPVAGFAEALFEAQSLRRLAARELVEAVAGVRAILRGPAAPGLLGKFAARLDTLTLTFNICPL